MQHVSSHDLAIALADRLNEIVPDGFEVRVQDSDLVVVHEEKAIGVSGAPSIMDTAEAIASPRENLETAVRASLSGVQDYITETLTEPWPGLGRTLTNPDARADGNRVELWFGSEEAPLIRLRPIDLA